MPINIEQKNNTRVTFGIGDIAMQICHGNMLSVEVKLKQLTVPVGLGNTVDWDSKPEFTKQDVALVFDNVKSIEALEDALHSAKNQLMNQMLCLAC